MTRFTAASLLLLATLSIAPSAAFAQDSPVDPAVTEVDPAATQVDPAVEAAHWDAIRDKLEKHADSYVQYWDEWLDQWWFFDTWADEDYQEQVDLIDAQLQLDLAYTRSLQRIGVPPQFPPMWDPRSPVERYESER